jgi:hypothetical protein
MALAMGVSAPARPGLAGRLDRWLFSGFSAESLGLLRIAFGFSLLPLHVIEFESLVRLNPAGPWFRFLEPMWHFEMLGIERHVPWLSIPVFVVLVAATVSMAIGWWTRTSIATVMLAVLYLHGVRDGFSGDVHHRYLVAFHVLFLLLVSRAGDVRSLDARRAEPRPVAEWEASWPIRAAELYCASFYLWSAIAKLRISGFDWVAGGGRVQELLLKRSLMWGLDESGRPLANLAGFWIAERPTLCFLLGVSTLVFELAFPLVLLVRRDGLRFLFLAGVTGFHLATLVVAYVGFVFQPVVFLVFFDLEKVRRRLRARFARPA